MVCIINAVISATNNLSPVQGNLILKRDVNNFTLITWVIWGCSWHTDYGVILSTIDEQKYGVGLHTTNLFLGRDSGKVTCDTTSSAKTKQANKQKPKQQQQKKT